jgi:hypothetical protein
MQALASPPRRLARVLTALLLFGVSFGYVEAAVVVYLRALLEPEQPSLAQGELFPLKTKDQLEAAGRPYLRWLATEVAREAATLAMLAAVALALARSFREWFAAFLAVFGIWDIFFYLFLKVLLDWPASLLTWDLLFLLPVPWVGPVLAPVLVALSMIVAGVLVLWREASGRPVRSNWPHWLALCLGGLLIVTAFCWDYRNILAGGEPNPFNWPLFLLGVGVGLTSFLHAFWSRPESWLRSQPPS